MVLRDVPNVDYLVSQFLYFRFDIGRGTGIVHVLEHYPIGAFLFRLVGVEFCVFSAGALMMAL
jgi:hypothetical protein